jgi:cytochrome c-type biogenesis protein CcmH
MRRFVIWALFAALMHLAISGPAYAVKPDEMLHDPALEARARAISAGLRCPVCQNQSIDDSDAQLARDLRLVVREHLLAGESDQAIRDFLVARYGSFILLKPPLEPGTILLWAAPLLALAAGAFALGRFARSKSAQDASAIAPLSANEQAEIAELLKKQD